LAFLFLSWDLHSIIIRMEPLMMTALSVVMPHTIPF
jgi:hypothetical protein